MNNDYNCENGGNKEIPVKSTSVTISKVYFRLIYKDLYFYKNEKDEDFKGLHNLSGIYINEEESFIDSKNNVFFCFSIIYPSKIKKYYCENKEVYNNWVISLRKVTGYSCLTDKYSLIDTIGKGKFGIVKLGIHKQTSTQVAIKILNKREMKVEDLTQIRREVEILKVCQHPFIINLHEIFENSDFIYIVMEYCSGNDLFTYLKIRDFHISEKQACLIIKKLLTAIYYLSCYGICHRDLKPENILMTSNKEDASPKIVDFGLSKIIGPDEFCTEPYGTLIYVAPEILQGTPYNKMIDMWSLGVITYLLLTGIIPFDAEEGDLIEQILYESIPYPKVIWNMISPESKDFVESKN